MSLLTSLRELRVEGQDFNFETIRKIFAGHSLGGIFTPFIRKYVMGDDFQNGLIRSFGTPKSISVELPDHDANSRLFRLRGDVIPESFFLGEFFHFCGITLVGNLRFPTSAHKIKSYVRHLR